MKLTLPTKQPHEVSQDTVRRIREEHAKSASQPGAIAQKRTHNGPYAVTKSAAVPPWGETGPR